MTYDGSDYQNDWINAGYASNSTERVCDHVFGPTHGAYYNLDPESGGRLTLRTERVCQICGEMLVTERTVTK